MSENKQVKNGGREAEPTSTFKIRTKDTSVNLKNIDKNLMGYINTLPEEMQKEVVMIPTRTSKQVGTITTKP